MYARLSPLCLHTNKKLRDNAFSALDAFMQQVSNELISGQRSADANRETFKVLFLSHASYTHALIHHEVVEFVSSYSDTLVQFFVRKFFGILEAPTGTVREKSIAIRGLGKLAGPIRSFMGTQELRKTIQRLFQFSESYYKGYVFVCSFAFVYLCAFVCN